MGNRNRKMLDYTYYPLTCLHCLNFFTENSIKVVVVKQILWAVKQNRKLRDTKILQRAAALNNNSQVYHYEQNQKSLKANLTCLIIYVDQSEFFLFGRSSSEGQFSSSVL